MEIPTFVLRSVRKGVNAWRGSFAMIALDSVWNPISVRKSVEETKSGTLVWSVKVCSLSTNWLLETCSEQSCFNQEPACIACFTGEDCCLSAQCVCKDGLYRNHKGFCVELDRCPNRPKCGENEEWTECGNQCTESACCPVNSKCSEPICAQEIIKN